MIVAIEKTLHAVVWYNK